MNFFAHQAQAKRTSRWLTLCFALSVVTISVAIGLTLAAILSALSDEPIDIIGLAMWLTGLVGLTILAGSAFKMVLLAGGGGRVARSLGAVQVHGGTSDFHLRRLRNVVEEMSIASGVAMPELYVLEQELAINAFAAGWTPADAAICVTRGSLERLSRDELQGVIGHEFSHILNGDMRLNIRLMGLIFGILLLGLAGETVLRMTRHSNSRDSLPFVLIGVALFALGYLGVFFGRLIKASISRQREFLADASSAQFTRQPTGLAGALKKAAALSEGTLIAESNCEEVGHMMFGEASGLRGWFATHPPLISRIKKLDPSFRESELPKLAALRGQLAGGGGEPLSTATLLGETAGINALAPGMPTRVSAQSAAVVASIANPSVDQLEFARLIHEGLPRILRTAANAFEHARELVVALLISASNEELDRELALIERHMGKASVARVAELFPSVDALHPVHRLPLLQLAFPQIKRHAPAERTQLLDTVAALVAMDGNVDLFEFCIAGLLKQLLSDARAPEQVKLGGKRNLRQCRNSVTYLMAVLAGAGSLSPEQAAVAFQAGINEVFGQGAERYVATPPDPQRLDTALHELNLLDAFGKQALIGGLCTCLLSDGAIAVHEAELLRTICLRLHCPLPPLLGE